MGFGVKVDVSGPAACFTRPELKAERVSYNVMTPSAARGVLEAVYWKPAICWVIDRIRVINPVRFDTFRRNELKPKISYKQAKRASKGADIALGIDASDVNNRTQRATVLLRDVRYVIEAHFEMTEAAGAEDTVQKHYNIALRRLRKGQCFNQPYFGCREFAVGNIRLIEDDEEEPASCYAGEVQDLGWMLYDLDYAHEMQPQFFHAIMDSGDIDVAAVREELFT